jgi:hypothetical protein
MTDRRHRDIGTEGANSVNCERPRMMHQIFTTRRAAVQIVMREFVANAFRSIVNADDVVAELDRFADARSLKGARAKHHKSLGMAVARH